MHAQSTPGPTLSDIVRSVRLSVTRAVTTLARCLPLVPPIDNRQPPPWNAIHALRSLPLYCSAMHLKFTPMICSVLAPLNVTLMTVEFAVFSLAAVLYNAVEEIAPPA